MSRSHTASLAVLRHTRNTQHFENISGGHQRAGRAEIVFLNGRIDAEGGLEECSTPTFASESV